MIVFKDLITGDELFSDSYKYKLIDDLYYEVDGRMTTETTDISDAAIGGNASAEEPTETSEASSVSGIDFVLQQRLQKIEKPAKLKDFKVTILKPYLGAINKKLKEKHPDRVDKFQKGMMGFLKERVDKNYSDWDLYLGNSFNPEGMHVMVNFREDGVTPFMVVFKDGIEEEKF
eukprot:m.306161 g.306161  ORF g.306161 m.306161 type:complete len:174 (+) comp41014_c0_seq1:132-653(+)